MDLKNERLRNNLTEDCSPAKKQKGNCSFADSCYRQKLEHFQEYGHPHLESLLRSIGDGEIKIPSNFISKVSSKTLTEQLKIMRELNGPVKLSIGDSPRGSGSPRVAPMSSTMPSSSCATHDRDKDTLEKIRKERAIKYQKEKAENIEKEKREREISEKMRKERLLEAQNKNKDTQLRENEKRGSGNTNEKEKHQGNTAAANKYRIVVWDRTKVKVSEKLKAAEPYNIFLTVITDSPQTHSEMLSIQIPELLDPSLGDLESSLQINFMVEFGWLLAQYNIMGHNKKPMTLLYGETDMELDMFKHFLTHAKVKPPSPFGSHHTKMMMFSYKDGSIRVVVCTANLVESDWDNRTQGLWISPACRSLPPQSDTGAGESPTFFKRDLLRYLSAYQLPQLQPWIGKVKRADFSAVKVFFISSVPGNHHTDKNSWGQLGLYTTLSKHITVPDKNSYEVIVQCSSIGSLGPKPDSWLMGEMLNTFCGGKKNGPVSRPPVKFIYPSFDNISNSHDGLLGGGCLPYSQKTHMKQEWLTSFLCQWKSDSRYRSKASPHIKSYCRVSPDYTKMSYFVLTSANMSKAAWGTQAKSGSLNILSYEAGVLLLPQFILGQDYFPLKKTEESGETPLFSLPYDVPTTPYLLTDVPWFIDNLS